MARILSDMVTISEPFFGRDHLPAQKSEVGLFVPVEEVFPGVTADESTLLSLLQGLSRDDTLFMAARLNTIISGPGDFDIQPRQQQALSTMCTSVQIGRVNDFARRHRNVGTPAVFFRGQLLELMRWTALHAQNLPDDGTTFEVPECRERFVAAALIAGSLWAQRVYGSKLSAATPINETRLKALGALRKGVEEGNLAPHIGIAIGRGLKLFTDYLPRHLPGLSDQFRAATGLSINQYLSCATALCVYTQQRRPEGPLFITHSVAAATTYKDIYPTFFALETQNPEHLAMSFWDDFDKVGYKVLRERPIMETSDGRAMILDPTFFIERISIGALFHLAKGKPRTESMQIFSAFGDAFEEYVADMLRRMYPCSPILVNQVVFNATGRDAHGNAFEIDAARLAADAAVVIETKAVFLREDAVTSADPEDFVAALRAAYGASAGKKERDKGVAQLARSIGAIVRGEWVGEHGEFASLPVIYPVLVAHDTRLDAPALGHFLENEFRALLGPVPTGKRVAPLTVMTIQDLENLEKSVSDFSLVELLEDYSRECPDRMRSLHNFIAFSDYGAKIKPSDFLMDASIGIHDVLIRELFPKADTE
jgi:hypothetical protein